MVESTSEAVHGIITSVDAVTVTVVYKMCNSIDIVLFHALGEELLEVARINWRQKL